MSPPEKKGAAPLEAAPFQTYAADTVAETEDGRNLKPLPPLPPGYGFDEHNRPVPIVLPPTWETKLVFSAEQLAAAKFALVLLAWAIPCRTKRTARIAALDMFLHRDKRTAKEIARECRVTPNAIRAELRNLRALAREAQL